MARLARLVVPGIPHLMTQRGSRRLPVFRGAGDYRTYKALLGEWCAKAGTEIWAYCLMPHHVHLILVPSHEDGLRAALGETHRRYARHVNARDGRRGHIWRGRFASFPMDDKHVLACARYVEMNPVRAKLARGPRAWTWSSARAHLTGRDDGLVSVAPLLDRAGDWKAFLGAGLAAEETDLIRGHERTGHPLGGARFLARLKRRLGRDVTPRKPGRPAQAKA